MSRTAFTLLEIILALALSVLVLIAIGMAIDVHLNSLEVGRTEVEEARLARALLQRIADDLRSAVVYDPIDVDELVPDAMPIPSADELEEEESGVREAETLEPLEPEGTTVENLAESASPSSTPGLYGNQYELQIDVSRLPRLDQFQGTLGGDDGSIPGDLVCDVKTVVYYVAGATGDIATAATGQSALGQPATGLVRREMARATTLWAAEHGELLDVQNNLGPLAPEVAAIEFQYFDGVEWLTEWDSEAMGGPPVAVSIIMGVIPMRRAQQQAASLWSPTETALAENTDLLIYRLTVHLPAAQPADEGDLSSDFDEFEEDSTDEGSGDRPSGGSGSSGSGSTGGPSGGGGFGGGGGGSGGGGGGSPSGGSGRGGGGR